MTTPAPDADPGWYPAIRRMTFGRWGPEHLDDRHPLVAQRRAWLGMVWLVGVFGAPLVLMISDRDGADPVAIVLAIVGAVSLASVFAIPHLDTLDTDSSDSLRASHASPFRGRMTVAAAPAATSLLVAGLVGPLWVFFVGQAVTLVDFALIAPSARRVDRDQRRIVAAGSTLSLRAALRPSVLPD